MNRSSRTAFPAALAAMALAGLLAALPAAPAVSPAFAAEGAFDPSQSDAKAVEIAGKILADIGAPAWEKVRYVKFRYSKVQGDEVREERTHYWDRQTGRSRLETYTAKTKTPVVVVVDPKTDKGEVMLGSETLTGESADRFLGEASKYLGDDSLWLSTPFRLKEPGAQLRYEGEKVAGPLAYDMITAKFENSPDVRYRFYVNRNTGKIDSMAFVLKGRNVTPVAFDWVEWTEIDGMKFSLRKTQTGGEVDIVLDGIEVFPNLPDTVFTSTAPIDPSLVTRTASGR